MLLSHPELEHEFAVITEEFKRKGILVSAFQYNGFLIEFQNAEHYEREHRRKT